MKVGVPREIKDHEYRVGLIPSSARELCLHGHEVVVQSGAGAGIGIADEDYERVGAVIAGDAREVFERCELIVKVKEPQAVERTLLRPGQILFTYLHLAADPDQLRGLVASGVSAIAYETVTAPDGTLPLLKPMSEVAGRMAVQAGAHCLEKEAGGAGVLLGGVPGVRAASVVVIGGGAVGSNAVRVAMGMEADVTVLDRSLKRLEELDREFGGRLNTIFSTREALEQYVAGADLVIGAVLVPGAAAPKLVTREMVAAMRPGSVIVDVAIDQGGCTETGRPTSHSAPTYVEEGVVHYCVTNMPGAVARTAALALNNATLPFVLALADKGLHRALRDDEHLSKGLNVHCGQVTCWPVAQSLNYDYVTVDQALSIDAPQGTESRDET